MPILNLVKKLLKPETSKPAAGRPGPRIYPRSQHSISRRQISPSALKVLYRLHKAGFRACLVGGCVRDLLLGREPKDFDVATDAHPEQIRKLFRNCRLIGRRFRLAHVRFGREIIEVATFRAAAPEGAGDWAREEETGRVLRDNVYGTIEEDAWRRDFTVNALYYDIADFSVVDYVGGMEDLKAGVLRLIGEPEVRYREDPVRMLRAVRFMTKLGFVLDKSCETLLPRLAHLLEDIPPARLYEEVLKLFLSGCAVQTFEALRHYGLFEPLFPLTEKALARQPDGFPLTLVAKALENTDRRLAEDAPVTPYFLYAALLWEPVRLEALRRQAEGVAPVVAVQEAASEVLSAQVRHVAIPKRVALPMREVWTLQPRFERRRGGRPLRLLSHPRFRAAYDFLLLRSEAGEIEPELAEWWTRFQQAGDSERRKMIQGPARGRRRHRSRRRAKSKESSES
ncbi:poly(A) polymerase [Methylomarinovum caldicuralii]|uniref:Poly(A) polymerase I n=1 Tax=Methylomarinovum caldicuralii TaxID=438856 RepID=A0AAU9CSI0_9GAMM|nr:poly(A) polymerase [Methylomarinovum caldicuralii]